MIRLTASAFWRTVVCGFIATYVMTVTGFWQQGIGLPPVDVGRMIAGSLNAGQPVNHYGAYFGNVFHFINGSLLALIWTCFFLPKLRMNWFLQGLSFGIITTLAATLVVVPLVTANNILFLNTPQPFMMFLASLIVHLFYGVTLTMTLTIAGVTHSTMSTRRTGETISIRRVS